MPAAASLDADSRLLLPVSGLPDLCVPWTGEPFRRPSHVCCAPLVAFALPAAMYAKPCPRPKQSDSNMSNGLLFVRTDSQITEHSAGRAICALHAMKPCMPCWPSLKISLISEALADSSLSSKLVVTFASYSHWCGAVEKCNRSHEIT